MGLDKRLWKALAAVGERVASDNKAYVYSLDGSNSAQVSRLREPASRDVIMSTQQRLSAALTCSHLFEAAHDAPLERMAQLAAQAVTMERCGVVGVWCAAGGRTWGRVPPSRVVIAF